LITDILYFYFVFLLLIFHKFLEPKMCCTLRMDSDACDGFVGAYYREPRDTAVYATLFSVMCCVSNTGLYKDVSEQARDFDDPPGLVEKTEYLLREWISIHYTATTGRDPTRPFSLFVQQVWHIAVSVCCT
jgi:hypothetical protein